MERAVLVALVLSATFAGCLGGEPATPVPTGQIDGAVVDQLLRPFAEQTVYLSELGLQDSTSRLGGFTFREVPVGAYTLLVTREGTRGAVAFVDVEADRVTKVILQLMPVEGVLPSMAVLPHDNFQQVALRDQPCGECTWTAKLPEAAPAEVVFEAVWAGSPLGHDGMRFEVTDDAGSLTVRAHFGEDFTPRLNFEMRYVVTLYYGATKAELFHQET
jgi:hypothetical protein